MAKIRVTISKNDDGTYRGESSYNHNTGLAAIGGGVSLISQMSSDGKMIVFISKPHIYKESILFKDGVMSQYASKADKMHYNAHLKELHALLNPETIEQPIYKKYIVLESGRSTPGIKDAREIKNSLEIKGEYCTYMIRVGQWVEATEYKIKFYEAYIEKQKELNNLKQQLFITEKVIRKMLKEQ